MSRIDEALKRASARGAPAAEIASRRPLEAVDDQSVLDLYVPERVPLAVRPDATPAPPQRHEPAVSTRAVVAPRAQNGSHVASLDRKVQGTLVMSDAMSHMCAAPFRRLAGALHKIQTDTDLKSLVVTSALPSEGKTLTVANVALTIGDHFGKRVLLVDADLRRPSVHTLFSVRNAWGLSEVLRLERDEVELIQISDHLSVVPAGHPDWNALVALTSDRMEGLLQELSAQFDWVLLDAPPVEFLPDPQLLARLTGGVLLVIGAGSTPYPLVRKAISALGAESIIGTVLNRVVDRAAAVHSSRS